MRIVIVTPDGELYNEEVSYVLVSSKSNGEYGILPNHLPIASTIDTGFLKLEQGDLVYFVVIIGGLLEHHNNLITVIAQDAFIGRSKEQAMENLKELRELRLEENRKRNVELMLAERELKRQISQSGAGEV
ncbi:MAG: ATP synthase F1 subunit epsilon [Candidatus Izemoplasmatales bacterium]|nr:ATP synthase F1 subunit epsilon [Candidatus Izemoplasmatales bacterium]